MKRSTHIAVAIGIVFACPRALAETRGRVTVSNAYTMMEGPTATFDVALLRLWLVSEQIGGRNMSLHVDARSDVPLLNSTDQKHENADNDEVAGPFTEHCRGSVEANPDCEKVAIRTATFGQLSQLVGINDAFLMLGSLEPGDSAVSIGRKTFYEAGLATVDGVTYEKTFSSATRIGLFGGLAPHPITRMVSPDYQAAGGYYSYNDSKSRAVRVGATAQLFGLEPDRISLFNQSFLLLSTKLTLTNLLQFDLVPGPEDRFVLVNLTYKPSGRYRIRLALTRYRPVDFAVSTDHGTKPFVFDDGTIPGTITESNYRTEVELAERTYTAPEVLSREVRVSPINQGKLIGHYVTENSVTPFVSLAFRQREIDGKSAIIAGVGAYTYDPYDTGIVARLRVQRRQSFGATSNIVGLYVEREVAENVSVGGGGDLAQSEYDTTDEFLGSGSVKSASVISATGQVRYVARKGWTYYLQADFYNQRRDLTNDDVEILDNVEGKYIPSEASREIGVLGGVTYRF